MENVLLVISSWGGLGPRSGSRQYKIMENGDIIFVDKNYLYSEDDREELIKTLLPKELKKVYRYIEKDLIKKEIDEIRMRDACFDVMVNYRGIIYKYRNDIDCYHKTQKFINRLLRG